MRLNLEDRTQWADRARDDRLPMWLRVASVAYALRGQGGHATLARGDLAAVLIVVDLAAGQVVRPSRSWLDSAIQAAIGTGWLAPGSTTTCLIVPEPLRGGDAE